MTNKLVSVTFATLSVTLLSLLWIETQNDIFGMDSKATGYIMSDQVGELSSIASRVLIKEGVTDWEHLCGNPSHFFFTKLCHHNLKMFYYIQSKLVKCFFYHHAVMFEYVKNVDKVIIFFSNFHCVDKKKRSILIFYGVSDFLCCYLSYQLLFFFYST